MRFDLLIKNGLLIDPSQNIHAPRDVAIKRNRVAAVDHDIPADSAARVIDAAGQIVTPGLVDLHTHVYYGVTFWGIQADPVAARSGVTTWLDVGSAGAFNLIGLRDYIVRPARARIYALLNISAIGLTAMTYELANLNYCDVDLCCKLIDAHRDFVLGVKARIDANTVGANGLEPLRRARDAADRVGMPLMVHIGIAGPDVRDVLAHLKPGDILTHCFTGHTMRIIGQDGRLLDEARRAWERGVIMDIGHGAGSFSFETAEALMSQGYPPDVISTDIHQMSVHGPLFDMPTCMSKFLALGMSLEAVVRATTIRPAQVLGLQDEVGTLKPGAYADVALFRLCEGDYTFYDVFMNARKGRQLLCNTLTIVNGRPMERTPDGPTMPWIALTEEQQMLVARGHTPAAMARAGSGCC
ncbi:MAG: amidohydrolase/deacetylase family metallohydrolase [Thermoflexales bacterium]|nr:amidohydrolase/deacetylase family metallohydrolase [Thermoflexales bacterium]MDW8352204.1 amidohydrolase/deacetylase family metallohydrolase [Anaerolineae bacterium]